MVLVTASTCPIEQAGRLLYVARLSAVLVSRDGDLLVALPGTVYDARFRWLPTAPGTGKRVQPLAAVPPDFVPRRDRIYIQFAVRRQTVGPLEQRLGNVLEPTGNGFPFSARRRVTMGCGWKGELPADQADHRARVRFDEGN
jgi:hypothetical protein